MHAIFFSRKLCALLVLNNQTGPKIKDVAATWTWWLILVMSINRVLVWFSFVFTAAKKKWCLCSSRCSVATKHARIGRWLEEGATCPDPRGLDLFLDLETSNLPERSGLAMPIPRHSGTGTYYTFLRPCLVKKKFSYNIHYIKYSNIYMEH